MRKTKISLRIRALCDERELLAESGGHNKKHNQRLKEIKAAIRNCQRIQNVAPERMVLIEKKKRGKKR